VLISWTPEYAVGVPAIDRQHQELFRKIDALLEACNRGEGKHVLGETLTFLEDYVKIHFESEEKAMIAQNYPEYQSHRGEHQKFVENFMGLKKEFETEGTGIRLVALTNRIVVNWLKDHILMTDTKLGAFIKAKQSE
jgi:hemerythrin